MVIIKEINVIINLPHMVVVVIITVEAAAAVAVDIMITDHMLLYSIILTPIMSNGMASERNPKNNKVDGDNLRINFLLLLILPKKY